MLLAYYDLTRRRAIEDYRHQQVIYALTAPHARKGRQPKPPELPRILRSHGDP